MLVSVFDGLFWEMSKNLGFLHVFVDSRLFPAFPTSLVFSVFGQFCVMDAKIGSVPVRCVVSIPSLLIGGLFTGVGEKMV